MPKGRTDEYLYADCICAQVTYTGREELFCKSDGGTGHVPGDQKMQSVLGVASIYGLFRSFLTPTVSPNQRGKAREISTMGTGTVAI